MGLLNECRYQLSSQLYMAQMKADRIFGIEVCPSNIRMIVKPFAISSHIYRSFSVII